MKISVILFIQVDTSLVQIFRSALPALRSETLDGFDNRYQ